MKKIFPDGTSVEQYILQMLSIITAKHNCHITNVEIDNKTIEIDGSSEENIQKCALEIEEVLGPYID